MLIMDGTHLKEKLEAERKKLESEMGAIGRRNPLVPNDWESAPFEMNAEPDAVDQAENITDRENEAAIFTDLEARYDLVLAALARIEQGTYGTCEVCGSQIEEARLEADPAATTCTAHR